jgi:MFS family permease
MAYHSRFSETFRALRHYNYRLWFFGQGISLSGSWMQTVAQQVLIYRLTGSAAALGLVSLLGLLPTIPLSLWGGSLSDRVPKRAIILICQVLMLIQALLLAFLTWTGAIRTWHVYLLSILLSAVNAVDLPARQAFTVDMVEGKADLTNAIGLNSAMFNAARAIGPAMAGVLVAITGEATAFLVNGLTFVAVIISLLMMRNLPQSSYAPSNIKTLHHTRQGLAFILRERLLLVLISLVAVSAFLSMPYNTLMPVFASDVLGTSAEPFVAYLCGENNANCPSPEALPQGILLGAMGIGATLGALLVASLPENAHRGRMLTIGNLGFPAVLLLFSISRSFPLSVLLMLLIGINFTWQNALVNTLLQFAAPDEMRGRVMSIYTLTFQTAMRLGGMQAGLVADWVNAPFAVGIGAAFSLIYGAIIALFYPRVRRM